MLFKQCRRHCLDQASQRLVAAPNFRDFRNIGIEKGAELKQGSEREKSVVGLGNIQILGSELHHSSANVLTLIHRDRFTKPECKKRTKFLAVGGILAVSESIDQHESMF